MRNWGLYLAKLFQAPPFSFLFQRMGRQTTNIGCAKFRRNLSTARRIRSCEYSEYSWDYTWPSVSRHHGREHMLHSEHRLWRASSGDSAIVRSSQVCASTHIQSTAMGEISNDDATDTTNEWIRSSVPPYPHPPTHTHCPRDVSVPRWDGCAKGLSPLR